MKEPGLLQVIVNLSVWLKHRVRLGETGRVRTEGGKWGGITLLRNNMKLKSLDSDVRLPGYEC
jgi:hypothetical protein